MKLGKVVQSEGIELPNGKMIKSLEDENGCKCLGVLQFILWRVRKWKIWWQGILTKD